jgi:hypothetical protein
VYIPGMGAGWKFRGEFRRGRAESVSLECIVVLRNRREAEAIAYKKMVGADEITATEVSQDELEVLKLKDGDVHLSSIRLPSTNADIGSRRASLFDLRLPAALCARQRYIEAASLVADGGRGALQSFRNRSNASPRGSQSPQPSFVLRGPGLRELHLPFASAPAQKGGGSPDQNILVRPGSVSMSLDVFPSSGIELLMLSRQPAWLKTHFGGAVSSTNDIAIAKCRNAICVLT